MKIRTNFVSNSSSSSFVVVGVLTNHKNISYDEERDKYLLNGIQCDALYDDSAGVFCGDVLADGETLPEKEFTFYDLVKKFVNTANKLNVDISELKLYIGTRGC